MGNCDNSKNIRRMLLKTVGKDPDMFCYYVNILEAKAMHYSEEYKIQSPIDTNCINRTFNRKIADG